VSGPVQTVYVSNGRGGTVTPIDTATNTPGPPIPIGRGPGLIAITPDGKTAYVTSNESIVVPIDTAIRHARGADQSRGEPPGTPRPARRDRDHPGRQDRLRRQHRVWHGDADRHGHEHAGRAGRGRRAAPGDRDRPGRQDRLCRQPEQAAVPAWHSYEAEKRGLPQPAPDPRGIVTPIDSATNVPGAPIDVGNEPFAIAVTPDGKTVYVANTWENTGRPASAPGTVTPIATATNTPGAPIEVGSQPWAFAITPDGKTAYVINFNSHSVTSIATATGAAKKAKNSSRSR
jgi:DNA-binding beta-propeller fold protein YncE